ncbi:hypothetical protein BYT27DRAFT_7155081 [Phlegmacium glaucopus]|nr:hypothetical protein BYT27DRAFT_7155081 [Phlegmacium glaucopus]
MVRAGDILKAKPKHFIPRQEGVGNIGLHPVIALTDPNAGGYVHVALMSHCHPEGTPTRRASLYGLPIDPVKGESEVSIGQPKLIHQNNLKQNNPPMAMSSRDYMALKTEICKHYFICDSISKWNWLDEIPIFSEILQYVIKGEPATTARAEGIQLYHRFSHLECFIRVFHHSPMLDYIMNMEFMIFTSTHIFRNRTSRHDTLFNGLVFNRIYNLAPLFQKAIHGVIW